MSDYGRAPERRRARKSQKRKLNVLRVLIVLLAAALIVICVYLFARPNDEAFAKSTSPVNEHAVEAMRDMETEDVGSVIQEMNGAKESRDASVRESVSESESESLSIEESIAASVSSEEWESRSIEESIAESEYESSVAEDSDAQIEAALNAPLAGSHLVARSVVTNCDDTDIPYIRQLFSNCIVIGNSRAKNAVDVGILSDNEVKYVSGQSVDQVTPFCVECASLYAPKTLFIFGLNDVAHYDRDAEKYKADYTSMIQQYLAVNPTSKIYCMESLPLPEEAWPYFYRAMTSLGDFNDAVKRMCEENGWTYVSASEYADKSLITSEDWAHYGKTFYFLWAQTMATQMHLWEDAAGLGYELP